MKRALFSAVVMLALNVFLLPMISAQMMHGQNEPVTIPDKLPKPGDNWVMELKSTLYQERLSLAQYEADEVKYQSPMPYHMVIPQERSHISSIEKLLAAYGVPADTPKPKITDTADVQEAYKVAGALERDLIERYNKLLKDVGDPTSKNVLAINLAQTRMHEQMFRKASMMGGMGRH